MRRIIRFKKTSIASLCLGLVVLFSFSLKAFSDPAVDSGRSPAVEFISTRSSDAAGPVAGMAGLERFNVSLEELRERWMKLACTLGVDCFNPRSRGDLSEI